MGFSPEKVKQQVVAWAETASPMARFVYVGRADPGTPQNRTLKNAHALTNSNATLTNSNATRTNSE